MAWLLLLFVALPIAEIWLLLEIGGRIGFWPTLGFLVGIGLVGGALARSEGTRVLREVARARAEGRVPEEGLLGGLLVLAGGLLLVLPGLITDVFGLLLLFPPTRRLAARLLRIWLEKQIARGAIHVVHHDEARRDDRDDDVIDVEPVDEPRPRTPDDDNR